MGWFDEQIKQRKRNDDLVFEEAFAGITNAVLGSAMSWAFASDAAPNMAIAQTINHIPAVSIPAVGGWLWVQWGHEAVFLLGAAITLISLILAQFVDREIRLKSTQK